MLVIAVVVATPLAASAHATLVETDPANGSQLEQPPAQATVTFSEPVDAPAAAIRVFDSTGARLDAGDSSQGPSPEQVSVTLPSELGPDTYVVTWGVVSLDGHPIRGAFTFQVGSGAAADDSLIASLLGRRSGGMLSVAGAAARWVTYLAGLTAAGAALFSWYVARRRLIPPSVGRLIPVAALTAMAASVLQIPLFAGELSGGVISMEALGEAVTSPVGVSGAVRVVGLLLIAVAVTRQLTAGWLWPGVAGLVAAELLAGHTLTTQPIWLVLGADAVHVLGSAVWVGGLAALFLVLRRGRDAETAAGWISHFSTMAVWSVLALGAAGLVLASAEVRTVGALTSTTYGWTLVAKVGLAAAVIAAGAYNNRLLVPAIRRAADESMPSGESAVATLTRPRTAAWSKLRRNVGLEVIGIAVILAVTAVLVNLEPAAEAAGVTAPFSTYVDLGDGQLNLVVDPNKAGTNQIHAYVLTAAGSPSPAEGEAVMEFSLPSREIGPFVVEPLRAGPGHWIHSGPELAIPGNWEVKFTLGSGFGESVATTTVGVTP